MNVDVFAFSYLAHTFNASGNLNIICHCVLTDNLYCYSLVLGGGPICPRLFFHRDFFSVL